jgi:hypothetical protein
MWLPPFPYQPVENERSRSSDMGLLLDGHWLRDTEVKYCIAPRRGRWYVTIVFVAVETPLKFYCRCLEHYESLKKAEVYAQLFQRNMRKDARGTLKTNPHGIHFSLN